MTNIDNVSASTKRQIDAALAHARSKVALLVNPLQLKNGVLSYIKHVRVEVHAGVTSADFVCGSTTAVLYLSLQYHRLHPAYIYGRVRALQKKTRLRVLLVLVDVVDHIDGLHELSRMTLLEGMCMLVAGSEREAARYLETLRSYDAKGAEGIQERVGDDYASRVNAALSSIRGINRTDVSTLVFTFGAVKHLATKSKTELRQCPGIGDRKVDRLYRAVHQPFRTDVAWTEDVAEGGDAGGEDIGGDGEEESGEAE